MTNLFSLEGKNAWITGASYGIGFNIAKAFVAMSSDGTRTYGEVKADKEGTAELTVPEKCSYLFFVVMGAPTKHWSHPWTSGKASSEWSQNDEQWPYRVQFEQTKPL